MSSNSELIYRTNFPSHRFEKKDLHDVNVVDIPSHDVLTAGFPCQPFSIAGKRRGFDDDRSNVFWKILEIIKYHKPRCVILENVKNLRTHDNGRTFDVIGRSLRECGYDVSVRILDTCKVSDIPQHRERIYIVATFQSSSSNSKTSFDWTFLDRANSLNKPLTTLLERNVPDKYYYKPIHKIYDVLEKDVVSEDTVYQYRRTYVRMNKKGVCPTLTANMGTGGHNVPIVKDRVGIRKLTPHECFRFQGFPDTYIIPTSLSDGRCYTLAGNAVSFPVVKMLAEQIVNHHLDCLR